MKVVKTITPESVPHAPERFLGRCRQCPWTTRTRFEDTANSMAEAHVYATKHSVDIEEE